MGGREGREKPKVYESFELKAFLSDYIMFKTSHYPFPSTGWKFSLWFHISLPKPFEKLACVCKTTFENSNNKKEKFADENFLLCFLHPPSSSEKFA